MKGGYQGYPAPQRVLPTTDDIRGVTAYASTTGDLISGPSLRRRVPRIKVARAKRIRENSSRGGISILWATVGGHKRPCFYTTLDQTSTGVQRSRDLDLQRRADSHGSALGPSWWPSATRSG
jgi:hypothetical protein